MDEIRPEWIESLSAAEAQDRAKAAAEIYGIGRRRAEQAARAWWENTELAGLCGAKPATTVGLAVRPDTFGRIRAANDWPPLANVPPDQDANEFELHFDGGIALDILTSRDPEGPGAIARFLAKHGEGVQQVEFRCSDVNRAGAILREQFGLAPVYPEKRPGANGTQINFFLVPATDGRKALIELYESPQPD